MSPIDGWDVAVLIKLQYPQYEGLLDKPGVQDVLNQALSGDVPWSQDRLNAALANTPYFLNTPKEYRDLDIQNALDPASAFQKYQAAQLGLANVMQQTGMHINGELPLGQIDLFRPRTDYDNFIRDAVAMNWSPQDMKYALSLRGVNQSGGPIGGELKTNTMNVMKQADDMGVPLSAQAAYDWGSKVTGGMVDQNAVKGYLVEQAKSLFPGLADALDRGITVRQYADPYLQIAQSELGTDPNTISLTDPKWNAALNQIDPKTGARVSMSLSDWTAKIRSESQYGYDQTSQARSQGAQLSTNIAHMMGGLG